MLKNNEDCDDLLFTVKEFDVRKSKNGNLNFQIEITSKNKDLFFKTKKKKNIFNLTQREKEVLEQLAKGKSNNEIADDLDVSVHTVKAHVASILDKLAVEDRVKAVVKAISENIIKK